jgi:hypothetical protein
MPTAPTLIVLLPPIVTAVLGDTVRSTDRTALLDGHEFIFLVIAVVYLISLHSVH